MKTSLYFSHAPSLAVLPFNSSYRGTHVPRGSGEFWSSHQNQLGTLRDQKDACGHLDPRLQEMFSHREEAPVSSQGMTVRWTAYSIQIHRGQGPQSLSISFSLFWLGHQTLIRPAHKTSVLARIEYITGILNKDDSLCGFTSQTTS